MFYIDIQDPASDTELGKKTTATDTLLILHGFPTSSADFQGQVMDALQQKFRRVITFDYPGAQCSAPDIFMMRYTGAWLCIRTTTVCAYLLYTRMNGKYMLQSQILHCRGELRKIVLAGFGFSDKPRGLTPTPYSVFTYADVAESLLEYLDVAAVHVLAHDIGDTVAQELMARHISRQAEGGLTGTANGRGSIVMVAHKKVMQHTAVQLIRV